MKHYLVSLVALAATTLGCQAPKAQEAPRTTHEAVAPHLVFGESVDAHGNPVRARVALVRPRGSNSTTTEGKFTLPGFYDSGPRTLVATTEDGLITWKSIEAGDHGPHLLVLEEQGAFLDLVLESDEDARVGIDLAGVRIHDQTLRPGKPATLVVPAGDDSRLVVRLDEEEQHAASFGSGTRSSLALPR